MKTRMHLIAFICALTVLASCVVALAQSSAQEKAKAAQDKAQAEKDLVLHLDPMPLEIQPFVAGDTFTFVASEMSFGGKVVKGAPYSAQAVTENTQTLADGNRIVRKTTQDVYRDSEGRTRHDQAIGGVGPYAAAGDPPQTVFINDPVDHVTYILDPRSKSARKMQVFVRTDGKGGEGVNFVYTRSESTETIAGVGQGAGQGVGMSKAEAVTKAKAKEKSKEDGVVDFTISDDGRSFRVNQLKHEMKKESLGKQLVEGVEAEGTRETFTIPAGEIGNEKPIDVVTETWYSPELQVVVMRKHTDPRLGETLYHLTNINRNEPLHSLFEVPSDYTLKEAAPDLMKMKMEREMMRKPKQDNQ